MSEIKVEEREHSRRALTMTIPSSSIEREYSLKLASYAKDITLKGFRKGKAPLSVVERQIGEYVLEEVCYSLIEDTFKEEVDKMDFKDRPLAYSQSSIENEESLKPFSKDKDLVATVAYDVYPAVELGDYTGLEFTVPNVEITDKDIDEEIQNLREQNASVVEKSGEAATGDIVTVDYAELDGEDKPVEGTAVNGYTFTLGSGYCRYKFDDDVVGMKAGDEKIVEKTYDESVSDEDLRGRTVRLSVKLDIVKERMLPDLDDEFAQDIKEEYKTVQDLKDSIRKSYEDQIKEMMDNEKLQKVLNKVVSTSKFEIPESMSRFAAESETRNYLRRIGRTQEEIERLAEIDDSAYKDLIESLRSSSDKSLAQQIVMQAIQENGVVSATDEELEKELKDQIRDDMDEKTKESIRAQVKDSLEFSKVPQYLLDNNKFTAEGDKMDLKDYMSGYYIRMNSLMDGEDSEEKKEEN